MVPNSRAPPCLVRGSFADNVPSPAPTRSISPSNYPACVAVPQPIAESCNELCARQCPDSSAFIQPPPVVVTFPGPILSSFPQQAVVGSSGAPAFGGNLGLGGLYGAGATQASGGLSTFGRPYAPAACSPLALPRYTQSLRNSCGPC
uniref:Keratin n=1 Tax=Melopsittacus undulatus TaxID=13146 RepID=A0A8V5GSV2_MELUD